eukprot:4149250-Pleurochrysis_carterae.AAC.1
MPTASLHHFIAETYVELQRLDKAALDRALAKHMSERERSAVFRRVLAGIAAGDVDDSWQRAARAADADADADRGAEHWAQPNSAFR